jgi:hypothetical protein
MRKRVILSAGIVLLSVVAYATASLNTKPEQQPQVSTFDDIDNFRKSLSTDLAQHPESFSVAEAATKLGAFRLKGGIAVCSAKAEIEAKQYVLFSGFMDRLSGSPVLTSQFNALLDSDAGVTDCQFRVTEGLAKHAQAK